MKSINKLSKIVLFSFFIWLIVRTFIFQSYKIPTLSMLNTYKSGDYIFVNKLAFGARIPITPLSLPFSDLYLDWIEMTYLRVFSFSDIERNDVLVFNYPLEFDKPIDHKKDFVKRCVALPGETFELKNNTIFINNEEISEVNTILKENFKALYSPGVFPHSYLKKWTKSDFGPLKIPKKGNSIELNKENLLLFSQLIEKYEENKLETKNDSIFINSIYQKHYTFKMDYFFMLGDNRNNSEDSRFWGVLPENHIIGKVMN